MLDPKVWTPQFDDDARAVAIGERSGVEFVLGTFDLFVPTCLMYTNTDDVVHNVRLIISLGGVPSASVIYSVDIVAGGSQVLYPGRILGSAGPPLVDSGHGGTLFSGPLTLIFDSGTAANMAHTPLIFSRWMQSLASMKQTALPITRLLV